MLDILGAGVIGQLIGAAGGIGTGIIAWLSQRDQNKHEQKMAELGHEYKVREHEVMAPDQEHARLIDHSKSMSGLRSLIRPLTTLISFIVATIIAVLLITGTIDPMTWKQYQIDAMGYLFGTSNMCLGF